jgi:3',5'-nucleoside bisphosphate phosphatase
MIDLHTHSTASDGSCLPERLVALALEQGLSALALTDHDTLDGVARAAAAAAGSPLEFFPGVEIEIACDTGEFHLLGLGLDPRSSALAGALAGVRRNRNDRNLRIAAKLAAAGLPVTLAEVQELAGGEVVSRAHFARLLVRKGIAKSTQAAFAGFIGKGMPFYEARACLQLAEACALIREAGGVSVIAHPLSLGLKGPALGQFFASARDAGVTGIEAWHPNHSVRVSRTFARLARGLGMPVSGGSDFHGEHMPGRKLGRTAGGREIPDDLLEPLGLHPPARRSILGAG